MSERFDAVVMGMGPAGEVAASRLLGHGLRVAVVERELIGGECAYWACIPTKPLLRPPEARAEARRAAGVTEPERRWEELAAYRDFMVRHLDDSRQVKGYEDEGATVVKGEGRIAGPGRVEVDGRVLETEPIVIATGSDPRIPPIEGLEETGYWTNREATTLADLPTSVVILGGGPVGIELGQFFRRMDVDVVLVEAAERLIPREDRDLHPHP
jgi:pyruvate/2-oxoglutarate dehydrogenase complex dihydrolipoamide dehydrogenase (E3) component